MFINLILTMFVVPLPNYSHENRDVFDPKNSYIKVLEMCDLFLCKGVLRPFIICRIL